jgi:hypothetical protein
MSDEATQPALDALRARLRSCLTRSCPNSLLKHVPQDSRVHTGGDSDSEE